MDRFIDGDVKIKCVCERNLKSNMDRFIDYSGWIFGSEEQI